MAYFSQEMKANVVYRLKTLYPDWKFGVKVLHHSKVSVTVLKADFDFIQEMASVLEEDNKNELISDGYTEINEYHYERHYEDNSKVVEHLTNIFNCINLMGDKEENYDYSDMQSDYFNVGFYKSLKIGTYDKPFEYVPTPQKKSKRKM